MVRLGSRGEEERDNQGVARIGRFRLAGGRARALWLVVHLTYLIGFKNRTTALLHWGGVLRQTRSGPAHHDGAADLRTDRSLSCDSSGAWQTSSPNQGL